MGERRERAADRRARQKKWGPFHYFLVVSSVLILVMSSIILFGGQPPPEERAGYAKKGRVFLFMVHGALNRYARYEGNTYPEGLETLVPRYLSLKASEVFLLEKLRYQRDRDLGYRLSLAETAKGEMYIILTPGGVLQGFSGAVGSK